ncbi:Aconitate hydratase, cytoplasmic [Glycine soja]|uniref:Aconitate hydratase, cytoplasmic n=1 Tax=Glycine soja TaxID=3848 RepID=A0A0B2PNS3_GLYSO|nr:hypothetical protein JHK87_004289 [Glycine soja]KAG5080391.1 hypothetical protein JHK86_004456 [Glycine max]KHN09364.1 Aconitate hydratase, cytoplasmic [Glycine soja]
MDRWSSSLGHGSMYGFLEPQSIHNAKDRHAKCQHYIESWVKESQREGPIGSWLFCVHGMMLLSGFVHCINSFILVYTLIFFLTSAMKTLKTTLDGKTDQVVPQWIEVKSHVQSGGYECGYYVMHWMWNIVSKGLKNDWSMVPVYLVIDHFVQVDGARSQNAVEANMELEFQRNKERFGFLKCGSNAFNNMLAIPHGSGIVHQGFVVPKESQNNVAGFTFQGSPQ